MNKQAQSDDDHFRDATKLIAANDLKKTARFQVGDLAQKIGGSYQATGTIKAVFEADDGTNRYVFRFDTPAGLLHIFSENQLAPYGE